MSVRSHVEDAEHLWHNGRTEGAWTQALIAAAATARKRYPTPMGDGEAFKKFICDVTHSIVSGDVGGPEPIYVRFYTDDRSDHRTLEDMLYKELRCNLVHEAELEELGFSEATVVDGQLEGVLTVPTRGEAEIPDFWVMHLVAAIRAAPENAGEF